jgi:hypothetical protein
MDGCVLTMGRVDVQGKTGRCRGRTQSFLGVAQLVVMRLLPGTVFRRRLGALLCSSTVQSSWATASVS